MHGGRHGAGTWRSRTLKDCACSATNGTDEDVLISGPRHSLVRMQDADCSDTASNKPGRADEALFAEALQAVSDLQSVSADGTGAAGIIDAVEEMLLEEIEAEAVSDEANRVEYKPPSVGADATADIESAQPPPPLFRQKSGGLSVDNRNNRAPLLSDDHDEFNDDVVDWPRLLRSLLPRSSLLSELRLLPAALGALLACVIIESTSVRRLPLLARLLYSYAAARLLAVAYQAFAVLVLLHMPIFEWRALVLKGSFGWASTAALTGLTCLYLPLSGIDSTAWSELGALAHFEPTSYWLLATAISKPLVGAWVQFYINSLRMNHYEQRAQEAHSAQTVLRVLVAAARVADRSSKGRAGSGGKIASAGLSKSLDDLKSARAGAVSVGSPDTTRSVPSVATQEDAGTSAPRDAEHVGGWSHFFSLLADLSGPLEFGGEFDDASSLVQARGRALKVFRILSRQPELQASIAAAGGVSGGGLPSEGLAAAGGLDRAVLIRWAARRVRTPIEESGVASLFKAADSIDADTFVACVERCYKEQRMITASVASFDRINLLLNRTCIGVWSGLVLFALLLVWGVSLTLIIIPLFTVVGTIVLVMGRAPGELVSGAVYTLFLRPFDIGDRIVLSKPGEMPVLFSLLVREIDVARTHFLTTSGELLLIENHVLRDMSMVNLSRSGPLKIYLQIKVSVTTLASKMTELVDSVKLYAAEKGNVPRTGSTRSLAPATYI